MKSFVLMGSWLPLALRGLQSISSAAGHDAADDVPKPETGDEGGPADDSKGDKGSNVERTKTRLITSTGIATAQRKQAVGCDYDDGKDYDGSGYTFSDRQELVLPEVPDWKTD